MQMACGGEQKGGGHMDWGRLPGWPLLCIAVQIGKDWKVNTCFVSGEDLSNPGSLEKPGEE